MKKYLLLMLLTPLAHSGEYEKDFYCEMNSKTFLSLKVNLDSKDLSFKIEDSFAWTNLNTIADKKNIVVNKHHMTAFDDEKKNIFLFNTTTKALVVENTSVKGKKGRELYEISKTKMLNNKHMGDYPYIYTCTMWFVDWLK